MCLGKHTLGQRSRPRGLKRLDYTTADAYTAVDLSAFPAFPPVGLVIEEAEAPIGWGRRQPSRLRKSPPGARDVARGMRSDKRCKERALRQTTPAADRPKRQAL